MTVEDALFGFYGYITSLPGHGTVDVAPLVDWIEANGLGKVSDDYPDTFVHPKGE